MMFKFVCLIGIAFGFRLVSLSHRCVWTFETLLTFWTVGFLIIAFLVGPEFKGS